MVYVAVPKVTGTDVSYEFYGSDISPKTKTTDSLVCRVLSECINARTYVLANRLLIRSNMGRTFALDAVESLRIKVWPWTALMEVCVNNKTIMLNEI